MPPLAFSDDATMSVQQQETEMLKIVSSRCFGVIDSHAQAEEEEED